MNQIGGDKYGKAFDYPEVSAHRSSAPPAEQVNGQIQTMNMKQNNIINLTEGRTTKIDQGGGSSVYNYIINPITNRKVKLSSRTGKKIIKNYIENFYRGGYKQQLYYDTE